MRFPFLTAALAALCCTIPATAQKLESHAASSMRNETRILVFNSPDFSNFAMASLTHGQPMWKAEYEAGVEKLTRRELPKGDHRPVECGSTS